MVRPGSSKSARHTRLLTPPDVAHLPDPCRTCLLWEAGVAPGSGDPADKAAWVRHVTSTWGPCGRVLLVDEAIVGFAMYAPPADVVGPSVVDVRTVSDHAVCLTALRVSESAPRGSGRMLVQAVVRDLARRREVRAIEAFGWGGSGHSACIVAVDDLLACGFSVVHDHPQLPRLRLDLRRVVQVPHTDDAWRALRDVVDHVRAPRPSTDPPTTRRDTTDPGAAGAGVR